MPKPTSATRSAIEVEDALDGLKVRLSHPTHDTHRLVGVLLFLTDEIGRLPSSEQASSFMTDLEELLSPIDEDVDLSGVRPELLEAAADVVLSIATTIPGMRHLRPLAGRFCAWAMYQYWTVRSNGDLDRLMERDVSQPLSMDPDAVVEQIRIHRPQCATRFESTRAFHERGSQGNRTSCRFPVIADVPHTAGSGPLWLGYNRVFECRISDRTPGADEFDVSFEHFGDTARLVSAPLRAARGLLKETHPGLLGRTWRGQFSMQSGGGAHAGASAGLAMALLAWCEIIRFSDERLQYRLSNRVMFTGEVDGDGHIHPVADEALAAKVDAAFFSNARILVLPEPQQHTARERVDRLQQRFPNRKLGLRGIMHVSDVLADRRIVLESVRSRPTHAARRFWQNKSMVALTVLALSVGGASMWVVENRVDPYPDNWRYTDGSYIVANAAGDELMRYTLNSTEPSLGRQTHHFQSAALVDIDGDGFRDFIWHQPRDSYRAAAARLNVTDGKSREVRSHELFDLALPYDRDLSIIHGRMSPKGLIAADLDRDGRIEVYSSAIHEYYPAVVVKTDALTGEVLDVYHHPGAIHAMNIHDLDGDGVMELLLGGTNNAFRQAVIMVLDPHNIGGYGPGEGTYQPGGGPTRHEKAYLRLPVTETGRLIPYYFNVAMGIRPMPEDRAVIFHTQETAFRPDSETWLLGGVLLTLDEQLRPVSVGTNDGYDKAWARAKELGFNPAPLDNAFKVGYMQSIERLTPDGWVPVELSPRSKAWNLPEL